MEILDTLIILNGVILFILSVLEIYRKIKRRK